jgi:hypothetical protein
MQDSLQYRRKVPRTRACLGVDTKTAKEFGENGYRIVRTAEDQMETIVRVSRSAQNASRPLQFLKQPGAGDVGDQQANGEPDGCGKQKSVSEQQMGVLSFTVFAYLVQIVWSSPEEWRLAQPAARVIISSQEVEPAVILPI